MCKKVAILQSNYIPWKGYFDLIAAVDEFILYDDMQYTRRDWRNRNQIKTPQGVQWLTVPVRSKRRFSQKIRETEINGADWAGKHWEALLRNYARAPHFDAIADWLKPLYLDSSYDMLSVMNRCFIEAVCDYLGIDTAISNAWDYDLADGRTERLVGLCAQAGAGVYISGPAARDYVEADQFAAKGIELQWFDYDGYAEYPQLWGEFEHQVTILDLLFNCGPEAPGFMKHVVS